MVKNTVFTGISKHQFAGTPVFSTLYEHFDAETIDFAGF